MNRFKRLIFLAGLLLLLAALAAGWYYYPRKDVSYRCRDCNVILVSIDTLRPDHLGCYGYSRPTSPNIDGFVPETAFFSTVVAQAPSTAPSHASMFTSHLPSRHGALVTKKQGISPKVATLAEILKERGLITGSFNGGGQLGKVFGFSRGFDEHKAYAGVNYGDEILAVRIEEAIRWLNRNKGRQFFLFLHTYEVHAPYAPSDEFAAYFAADYKGQLPKRIDQKLINRINKGKLKLSKDDRDQMVNLYDSEIRQMDSGFSRLIAYLKAQGLYDSSMIILTSDHGEEFGERGRMGVHSYTLYDELLRVPLMIKFPHGHFAGSRIDAQVRSIDIAPTILDVLGRPVPRSFEGQTLIDALAGRPFAEFALSQKDSKALKISTSVRSKRWKTHKARLFDMEKDAGETRDVKEQEPAVFEKLQKIRREVIQDYVDRNGRI